MQRLSLKEELATVIDYVKSQGIELPFEFSGTFFSFRSGLMIVNIENTSREGWIVETRLLNSHYTNSNTSLRTTFRDKSYCTHFIESVLKEVKNIVEGKCDLTKDFDSVDYPDAGWYYLQAKRENRR
tara:strand:+ start:799 stop:1179 length:381 start_codon:yes stop_codon:yes gene_type:complete